MDGFYDSRKTPHCREIGGLRKGASGVGGQSEFRIVEPLFEGKLHPIFPLGSLKYA